MTKGKSKKGTLLRVKSRQQEDDHEDVIEDMDFLTSEERAQLIYEEDQNESCDDDDDDHSDQETETRRLILQQNRKKKKSGGFQSMGLSLPVFKGIMKKGYRVPTPIQRKTIPLIMDGKDLVAMARTGSGKTAAFLVPLFERLKTHSAKIGARALILSPTRELALQTMKFTKELGHFTDLRAIVILGGDRIDDQFSALHENPDIIIATPGRFLHLLVEMELKLTTIEYIVFDEADRLYEMGFSEQLYEIIKRLPEQRQTLLFSATLPKLLVEFAKAGLSDPVLIRLDVDSKLSEQLSQSYLFCRDDDKPAVLIYLLHSIISSTNEQTIVFVPTKYHVEYLRELLLAAGIETSYVYSSLDPTARKINVSKFVHKKTNILLVTDIAARGIDIPLLDNVVNYNFPSKPKLFVHRVGRVARAGRSGTSYSLVSVGGPRQVSSPASSGGKSRKRLGGGGGGNPVKVHPIPSWQKGIDLFLNGNGSPHRTMGSTSSTSSTGSSQSEEDDTVIIEDSTTDKERVEDISSDQEERESEEDEEDVETEEDSEEGENSSCLALLPDDLVTLGSDVGGID